MKSERDAHADDADKLRIPLVEERLEAHVKERQTGKVTITKRVETEPVDVQLDIRQDTAVVERRQRDEIVSAPREPWYEDDILVIPLYEERLVTEKRLVLREEVRIRTVSDVKPIVLTETIRREVAEVEGADEESVPPDQPS